MLHYSVSSDGTWEVLWTCIEVKSGRRVQVPVDWGSMSPSVLRPRTVLLIFLYFTPCLTFSLRLMVTHRLDSCDHLLYRLVTRYVPCLYCCRDSIVPCDLLSHVDGL